MKGFLNSSRGFTLLEVMAALAILGFSILLVIQLFSGGLVSARVSEEYTAAVLHARGKIVETLLEGNLKEGVRSGGTDDGFSWRVEIAPFGMRDENERLETFKVKSWVEGPNGGKEVSLETFRTMTK